MGVCGTHTKPIFTQRSLANIGLGRSRLTRAGVSEHPTPGNSEQGCQLFLEGQEP